MMNLNLNKIRGYILEETLWRSILRLIPEDQIMFFDIEVYPLVEKSITPEHKIIAFGLNIDGETRVFINDNEEKLLKEVNEFLYDKPILLTVGYGSTYLDIPMILLKLRDYKLTILRRIFNKGLHLDLVYPTSTYLYAINKIDKPHLVSLKDAAKLLNLIPESYKFSEKLYSDKVKLSEYLKKDVELTRQIYHIIKNNLIDKL